MTEVHSFENFLFWDNFLCGQTDEQCGLDLFGFRLIVQCVIHALYSVLAPNLT